MRLHIVLTLRNARIPAEEDGHLGKGKGTRKGLIVRLMIKSEKGGVETFGGAKQSGAI
jgi:hypothetical protein